MSDPMLARRWWCLVGVIVGGGLLIALVLAVRVHVRQDWPTVQGEIVWVERRTHSRPGSRFSPSSRYTETVAHYRWVWADVAYEAEESLGVRQGVVGPVAVHVSPADPSDATIDVTYRKPVAAAAAAGTAGGILGVVFVAARALERWEARRRARRATRGSR